MSSQDSPFVLAVPTYYNRRHLIALPGRPWLRRRPLPPAVWPVLASVAVALLLVLPTAPILSAPLLFVLLLVGAILGVTESRERHMQICPACTSGMSRGSWRCPRCHFEAR